MRVPTTLTTILLLLATVLAPAALAGPGDPLIGINGSLTADVGGPVNGTANATCTMEPAAAAAGAPVPDCEPASEAGPGDPLTGINGEVAVDGDANGTAVDAGADASGEDPATLLDQDPDDGPPRVAHEGAVDPVAPEDPLADDDGDGVPDPSSPTASAGAHACLQGGDGSRLACGSAAAAGPGDPLKGINGSL